MAIDIFVPRLTHDMRSGLFVRWLKAPGERVRPGDALFEIETDKAVTEIAAEAEGVFSPRLVQPGDELPIGTVIAYLLADGEAPPDEQAPVPTPGPGAISPSWAAADSSGPSKPAPGPSGRQEAAGPDDGLLRATPIARRMARERGIDLRQISGSGPGGRIVEADLLAYMAGPRRMDEPPSERVPLTRLQALTGQRMALSSQTIPQFVLEVDVDMAGVQRLRQQTAWKGQKRPTYTAFLVKAVATTLPAHPRVNASFDEGSIRVHPSIHIGVAVATAGGLLVPVIHHADRLSGPQIQAALDSLRDQVRGAGQGGAPPASALAGGTFTLSNLGMYGVDRFQALVNPPQAAILAAGRLRDLPWSTAGGIQVRPILTLRLAADHRVLDGATAAPFLVAVKDLLEQPGGLA
jgi:pyruvate dehydrogenase E2 component (dihydrolipoamide acetyltransferase)